MLQFYCKFSPDVIILPIHFHCIARHKIGQLPNNTLDPAIGASTIPIRRNTWVAQLGRGEEKNFRNVCISVSWLRFREVLTCSGIPGDSIPPHPSFCLNPTFPRTKPSRVAVFIPPSLAACVLGECLSENYRRRARVLRCWLSWPPDKFTSKISPK